MDCEVLQQIQRYMDPSLVATGDQEIAKDAIKSVGEFQSIIPLLEKYLAAFTPSFIIGSFTTI